MWVCKAENCRARRCSHFFFGTQRTCVYANKVYEGFLLWDTVAVGGKLVNHFQHESMFPPFLKKEAAVGTEISFDASAHFIKLVTQSKSSSLAQIQFA